MSKKIFFVFLFLISFIYLFLRLDQLDNKIDFRLDQGVHLLEVKQMVNNQEIRLIGPMVTSKSLDGRNFFIGANYYYILAIIGIISSWNPLTITSIFIIIEFIFILIFILLIKKLTNTYFSIIIFLSLALSPYLVIHSRFFWNPHLLIPLSILSLIFLQKFTISKKFLPLFLASFFWGFAFACHYSAVFWGIFFLYFIFKSKNIFYFKTYLSIIFGFFLGDLPFFIFEIRHQFYNLKTFLYVYTHSSESGGLTSHYFVFPLLIFIIYFLCLFLSKIKNQKYSLFLLLAILLSITFYQIYLFPNLPSFGAVENWNFPDQQKVADIISQNCPKNFNIAATMQGDTRSYDLRFLLSTRNCFPAPVENYQSVEKLFLVASKNRPPQNETVWEVNSFKPFIVQQEIKINDQLTLYELIKN